MIPSRRRYVLPHYLYRLWWAIIMLSMSYCWWHIVYAVKGYCRPSQINPHQDSYEVVSALIGAKFLCAEDMSFLTICTDYNGPLLHSQLYFVGTTSITQVGGEKVTLTSSAVHFYVHRNWYDLVEALRRPSAGLIPWAFGLGLPPLAPSGVDPSCAGLCVGGVNKTNSATKAFSKDMIILILLLLPELCYYYYYTLS